MLTKTQKREQVAKATDEIKKSKNLIFADFSGVSVEDIRGLKKELREAGAQFTVVKKRLLNLALKKTGASLDTMQFDGPVGTVFATGDLTSVASRIYKFGKGKESFKVLGAYDTDKNSFLDADAFTMIAKLPSREILIAQIMGGISGTVRAFMSIVKQLSEGKGVAEKKTEEKQEEKQKNQEPLAEKVLSGENGEGDAKKTESDNEKETVEDNKEDNK